MDLLFWSRVKLLPGLVVIGLALLACDSSSIGGQMYTQDEKELALDLAYKLKKRDYESAYAMLSANLKGRLSAAEFRQRYERIIPQDWGEIDPIELVEDDRSIS